MMNKDLFTLLLCVGGYLGFGRTSIELASFREILGCSTPS